MKNLSSIVILHIMTLLAVLSGCANVDGGYIYTYRVRLSSATKDKRPEAIRLVVSLSPVAIERLDAMSVNLPQTGELQGELASGITWGYKAVFGIPLEDTRPPVPPPIDSLLMYINNGNSWKKIVVALAAESQQSFGRGWRKLELGNISEYFKNGSAP